MPKEWILNTSINRCGLQKKKMVGALEEIIHFKSINITADKLNSLREKIEKVKKGLDKRVKI